jgi:NAD(P)H-nitrite reductase large subunit
MSCNYCKESSKTSPENETICYCNNIRRLEIEKTIRETGLKTISEIKKHLRDKIISNCAELNPTGRCCHQSFNTIIQQVLENS